ncbi:SDR family NAD(P)-dependent oxidoreductase, partial [Sphingomonas sp.]|uniref:SDR family NAD(P)-dependent oxidoreductase n=1 Tax=Sphingomonas sp. TaxID=28214 RepID=UPI002DD69367
MLDFSGKVAFVAGAGSVGEGWGNGKATAVLLARQGAAVYGIDVAESALAGTATAMRDEGNIARWVGRVCDATSNAEMETAVADCLARFGRIDVLVNNIGGSAPGDPVSMSEELWQRQMDLNLKTAFLGCKHILPVMERQFEATGRGGAIVNLSSIGCVSFQVGGRVSAAYAASKAGVMAFGRSTAIAYVRKGIRVNTVVPGVMHTPLVENRLAAQLGAADAASLIAARHASVPMGRMGDAWDVAHAVAFLASD